MRTIRIETSIRAPAVRCFDLARSIDLHVESTAGTEERAVDGVTKGLIGLGETVTWEARHFGVRQRFTSKITRFEPPSFFQDRMLQGAFQSSEHDHKFERASSERTLMVDTVRFSAPLGALGRVAERLVLEGYLERFLRRRCEVIRQVAESSIWERYLQSPSG